MSNAVRLSSVLGRISILSSCISLLLYINGFQIVVNKRVTFGWYVSSFQGNICRRNKRYITLDIELDRDWLVGLGVMLGDGHTRIRGQII